MFLEERYVTTVKQVCKDIEDRFYIKFETIGFDEDHVHFMLKSLPKYSSSQLFRIVKSVTAMRMFKTYPEIKDELWGREFWSDGCYVGTVGEGVNAEIIRDYIKKQGRKGEQLKLFDFVT